jgi:hypothetical protein
MADGEGFVAVLPELGILLAFAALFMVVAIRRFEYD